MRTILRKTSVTLAITIGLLANCAYAQNPVRVVTVSGGTVGGEFEVQVAAALKARIGATTRYTISNKTAESDLEISVTCLDVSRFARAITGGICSELTYYWPSEFAGLYCVMGGPLLISGGNTAHIAEQFFQSFVESSTEKELASHVAVIRQAVLRYEAAKDHNQKQNK
jgi:hypothetical protein